MPPDLTVEDSPVEMLLKEQGTLQTPVGVFSGQHESLATEPEQAQFYKSLIPLRSPVRASNTLSKSTWISALVARLVSPLVIA